MTESKNENINTKSVNPDAAQLGFCMYVCMYYLSIDIYLSVCLLDYIVFKGKQRSFFLFSLIFKPRMLKFLSISAPYVERISLQDDEPLQQICSHLSGSRIGPILLYNVYLTW